VAVRIVVAVVVAVTGGLATTLGAFASGAGKATTVSAPTFAECTQLVVKSPAFRGSRLAATIACLRPASIRTTASVKWTTCPTTPIDEPCAEGIMAVTFRSKVPAGRDLGDVTDSWGGEDFPGAGIFSLPGAGTYRCTAEDIDRQQGRFVMRSYTKSLALRDQAVGFAAVAKAIRVATSIHPGLRGPYGVNANVRLGQPNTCQLSAIPVGIESVRAGWPGKVIAATVFAGSSTSVSSSGSFARSYPVPSSEGLSPGVRIEATIRWSSTIVVVPALKRR
jgi:hypothetical protein